MVGLPFETFTRLVLICESDTLSSRAVRVFFIGKHLRLDGPWTNGTIELLEGWSKGGAKLESTQQCVLKVENNI